MADYTNLDYTDLLARITQLMSETDGFTDAYESSSGQALIQLLADSVDALFFMLQRRSQEVFLDTARLDSSIITHASELGYRPRRNVSSSGTLLLEIVDTDGNPVAALGNIFIPRGTTVTLDEASFVTTEDYVIPTGDSSVEINIKEGTNDSITVDSTSTEFQETKDIVIEDYNAIEEFSMDVTAADGRYVDVAVESLVSNISSLSYALPTDRVYDIRFSQEGMRIIFGDGEFGKTPEGLININFIRSSGAAVSVVKLGVDFQFDSFLLEDDTGTIPTNLYRYSLTNITQVRGGSDAETSEEIARNAPAYVRTNSRAVTSFDHEFWVLRSGIGAIVDCRAYGEQESDSLVFNMNNAIVSYITADGQPLTPTQVEQLSNYMDAFKIITTHIAFRDVKRINLIADLKYRINDNIPVSESNMFTNLSNLFDNYFKIQRGSIGKPFQRSELMRDIQNMQISIGGVTYSPTDYIDLDVEAEYEIDDPDMFFEVYVNILGTYSSTPGDRWTLKINDVDYTYIVQSGDTINDLITGMQVEIQNGGDVLSAALLETVETDSRLRIKSRFFDSVFKFEVDLTDDLNSFTDTDNIITVPMGEVPGNVNVIVPGTAYILDASDVILYEDDGAGNMVDPNSVLPSFTIDYDTGSLVSPDFQSGDLRLRFQQNPIQNIYPGVGGVVMWNGFDSLNNVAPYSRITFLE